MKEFRNVVVACAIIGIMIFGVFVICAAEELNLLIMGGYVEVDVADLVIEAEYKMSDAEINMLKLYVRSQAMLVSAGSFGWEGLARVAVHKSNQCWKFFLERGMSDSDILELFMELDKLVLDTPVKKWLREEGDLLARR